MTKEVSECIGNVSPGRAVVVSELRLLREEVRLLRELILSFTDSGKKDGVEQVMPLVERFTCKIEHTLDGYKLNNISAASHATTDVSQCIDNYNYNNDIHTQIHTHTHTHTHTHLKETLIDEHTQDSLIHTHIHTHTQNDQNTQEISNESTEMVNTHTHTHTHTHKHTQTHQYVIMILTQILHKHPLN
eukprot:GHVR01012490.1.p1 GENE.GHVR01012490.1~~GHVR01012490.1.p1  ORF type:complete len:188 (-),score=120.61 GHVR01012490.1:39-602(-)